MSSKEQEALQEVMARHRVDYATLFGSVELCDCQQCRSIHSAAAYFVDVLQFLGPKTPAVTPLDVLIGNANKKVIGRRPDLAHILLSCENTNTPLPYVDLVNEALESHIVFSQTLPLNQGVVPPAPAPNESSPGATAEELAAEPENTRDLAYDTLEAAVYPCTLPFNQPMTSLRLTLEEMGSSRHEVMAAFRRETSEASGRAVDVEALKITDGEFAILTGERFDGTAAPRAVSEFYGFDVPVAPADTAWVAGALPAGAVPKSLGDVWAFAPFVPPPPSGTPAHDTAVAVGLHQHYFESATSTLDVRLEDVLFAEVFVDPAQVPQQIMLQWNDGTWEHRAYWGDSAIAVGFESTASRRYMGPLPAPGAWVRLEVPEYYVGLGGRSLLGAAFTLFGGHAVWGASGKRSPSWGESLAHVPTLLARTGIKYTDLIALLRTTYVNPAVPHGNLFSAFDRLPISYQVLSGLVATGFTAADDGTKQALKDAGITLDDLKGWAAEHFTGLGRMLVLDAPDSACDLTITRLQHLDGTPVDDVEWNRLHRFIRLWRKTGWSIVDLDRAFTALGADDITPGFLRELGHVLQLQAVLNLPPQKLFTFWGNIAVDGDDALYRPLFLKGRDQDPAFAPVANAYLPAAGGLKIAEHLPALLGAFRVRPADLSLILQHTGLASPTAALTLETTSILYRHLILARALKLSVQDLIHLLGLTGDAPFSQLGSTGTFTDVEAARTLRFVRGAEAVAESGVVPGLLNYLFSTLGDPPASFAPTAEATEAFVTTVREGLIRIAGEHAVTNDPTGDLTREKLELLFDPSVAVEMVALIGGTQVYSAPLAAIPAGVVLPAGTVTHGSGLLQAAGWLTDAEHNALIALSADPAYLDALTSVYEQPRGLLTRTLIGQLGLTRAELDALQTSVLDVSSAAADGGLDPEVVARRFSAFLAAVSPHLTARLSRTFVVETLADALTMTRPAAAVLLEGADGVVRLGADADKSRPAIADFLSLPGDGLTGTYFANETLTAPALKTQVDPDIDFIWDRKEGISVQWQGYLLPPVTARYELHLRAGGGVRLSVGGTRVIDRWIDGAPVEHTVAADLEAGKLYAVELDYFNHASTAATKTEALIQLRWSSPTIPPQVLPSSHLYSVTHGDAATAAHTFIRLHKASLLANGFALTAPELAHLADPSDADALDLNDLPVDAVRGDPRSLFTAWRRWNDFAALRGQATKDPAAILEGCTAATGALARAALVRGLDWDAGVLAAIVGPDGFSLADSEYRNPARLRAVGNAMRLLALFGATPADAFSWAATLPDAKHLRSAARDARRAHKGQYDSDGWTEAARAVTDSLREGQRAALVAYLLPRLGFDDVGELFGYFLIDVEMSPCMRTSRIKQAISSVQLFVQRCRMNQEPAVDPKMINGVRWEWMQNYRVWEANLRVFLHPENWIEPELRDDKSPFFRELESELLQEELTTASAETAVGKYLEKLDAVALLRICGSHEQTGFSPDEERERVLHVFGATYATPHEIYYRQQITVTPTYRYWTPWEKVPLDIEAAEVLPVMWNRRLYLFWQMRETNSDDLTQIRLAWSEYLDRKWAAKRVAPAESAVVIPSEYTKYRMDVEVSGDALTIVFATGSVSICLVPGVDLGLGTPRGPKTAAQSQRHASVTLRNYHGLVDKNIASSKTIHYSEGFTELSSANLAFNPVSCASDAVAVFSRVPDTGYARLFAPGSKPYTLNDPFFFQQGSRSYLVVPSSPVESSLFNMKSDDSAIYMPADTGGAKTFAIEKDLGTKLLKQADTIRMEDNPWSVGRATTAALEIRASGYAETIKPVDVTGVTNDTALFGYSVKSVTALVPELATFRFETFFHPYTAEFQKRLNRYGVPGLLTIDSQSADKLPPQPGFVEAYGPERSVKAPLPKHDVDFDFTGAYSVYNWELFFHIPLLIATRLSQLQRFEEATRWFHYIFDPTAGAAAGGVPQRYWNVRPFRETTPQRLDEMLKKFHAGDESAVSQWEDLQANPFQPHRVARMRPAAYQKAVAMKYFDNAIAWGDQLYRRDTIESINQATHLYVTIAILLGRQGQKLPSRGRLRARTYAELRDGLDELNQTIVEFENDLPFSSRATAGGGGTETSGLMGIGRSFYFCLPKNDKLSGYWDTVADRLFKIRHCMDIEGTVRDLPLFEPAIDPALLVQAAAQRGDLGSVLNDRNAPLPNYRFTTMCAKALELAGELRSLGSDLLATLEKRDAERLSLIRTTHETELLALMKQIRQQQVAEAKAAEAALHKSRDVTQVRLDFYTHVVQRIAEETNQLNELAQAQTLQEEAQSDEGIASDVASYVPDVATGMIQLKPMLTATIGRGNVIAAFQARSREKNFEASVHSFNANKSSIEAVWKRRSDDWKLQEKLAAGELAQIEKQIAAAGIRVAIAEKERDNTVRQIEQSQEVDEFMRRKFSNEDLYGWRAGGLSTIFFQCYQMAYDLARQAERSYRFELGLTKSSFVTFGSWDSQRKGLLSGERLHLQLKQMERAYLEANRRELELTKHYSLVQNDPEALITLKARGQCEFELPETLFDMDYPGHYMRRIKTVSVTIPTVLGPQASVNCTLTLLRDKTRVKSIALDQYAERDGEEDDRFVTNWTRSQAIATSGGQNDCGMFELTFRDERYLPFEGAGVAGSRWRLEMDPDCNAFDLKSVPDVVLHLRYTARDGGAPLKRAAKGAVAEAIGAEAGRPQARMFSLKHEFPTQWHQLIRAPAAASCALPIAQERFPFLFKGKTLTTGRVGIYAVLKAGAKPTSLTVGLTPPAGTETVITLGARPRWRGILPPKLTPDLMTVVTAEPTGATWILTTKTGDVAKEVDDLLLVCEYAVTDRSS